jgi:hypothetical protein
MLKKTLHVIGWVGLGASGGDGVGNGSGRVGAGAGTGISGCYNFELDAILSLYSRSVLGKI